MEQILWITGDLFFIWTDTSWYYGKLKTLFYQALTHKQQTAGRSGLEIKISTQKVGSEAANLEHSNLPTLHHPILDYSGSVLETVGLYMTGHWEHYVTTWELVKQKYWQVSEWKTMLMIDKVYLTTVTGIDNSIS